MCGNWVRPSQEETARVRRLELREERALRLAALGRIVEREQAGRMGVDLAAIVDGQAVAARLDRGGEADGRGLRLLVHRGPALRPVQRRARELHVDRVDHDRVRRLQDLDVDLDAPCEAQMLGVRRRGDRVMARAADIARQLARHLRRRGGGRAGGLRLCRRALREAQGGGERENGGGKQGRRRQAPFLKSGPQRRMRRSGVAVKRNPSAVLPTA